MQNSFITLATDCVRLEILKKLVFSRPRSSEIKKVSARLVSHRGKRLLAFEYSLPGNTVSHKNVGEDEAYGHIAELLSEYMQANLITTEGDVEYKISSSGKEVLLGSEKLRRKLNGDRPSFEKAIETLDREKNYILSGGEDFLIELGISDKNGRVHDKKQGKFRQINKFLQHIEELYGELEGKDELVIYDLCCGKSYLSFAVYYYLTEVKKRTVKLLGIDLKRDVILWCSSLSERLGYSGMKFVYGDVKNTPKDVVPDMVISLHACDVATDIVLDCAIKLGAKVVLSTPCCHRYLSDKTDTPELSFVTRYSHLNNKLCEAMTDAIRAARLSAYGYNVRVVELTDPNDTPKNTLIRATLKKVSEAELSARKEEYERILEFVLGKNRGGYLEGITNPEA